MTGGIRRASGPFQHPIDARPPDAERFGDTRGPEAATEAGRTPGVSIT
jgi:hypothetical protein